MAEKPKSAEIYPGPGFRIRKKIKRPPLEIIEEFRKYESPDISDLMNRLYAMSRSIHHIVGDNKFVGPACTVKVYPGDNLMVHKALDVAKPGDVIVVDTGGTMTNAVIGDLVASKAKHRGIAGFVIDGLVRDYSALKEVDIPIFARGVTPIGPLHRGPGELNFAISCGNIVVNPGDIVCADQSGVVVVCKSFSTEILTRLRNQKESLDAYVADVKKGIFSNAWVDNILNKSGCEFIE